LNGDSFGAFGVLCLGGFGEAARFFFFWRTHLDELSGALLTGRSLLRHPLRSLDSSVP
jgi:hypothetical protein